MNITHIMYLDTMAASPRAPGVSASFIKHKTWNISDQYNDFSPVKHIWFSILFKAACFWNLMINKNTNNDIINVNMLIFGMFSLPNRYNTREWVSMHMQKVNSRACLDLCLNGKRIIASIHAGFARSHPRQHHNTGNYKTCWSSTARYHRNRR